jgi:hypothetical protein
MTILPLIMAPLLPVVCSNATVVVWFQASDVMVQRDDQPVSDTQSLGEALAGLHPADFVAVYRGNHLMTMNIKRGEIPARSEVRFFNKGKTLYAREAATSRMKSPYSFRPARCSFRV